LLYGDVAIFNFRYCGLQQRIERLQANDFRTQAGYDPAQRRHSRILTCSDSHQIRIAKFIVAAVEEIHAHA